ncbi:MAG: cysteine desulfurase family protein [Kofleriaceae bacterium]
MSTHRRIYLDYNASSPILAVVRDAVAEAMDQVGNPSSIHEEGRRVRSRISRARAQVAALAGRSREQVVFTSGGTEANTLGVLALARLAERRGRNRVIATTAIEHPSLRGAVAELQRQGWTVTTLDDADDADDAKASVAAFAAVNHELGTVEPRAMSPELRARGMLVHVDAVQATGKLALDVLAADTIAISGHKIGGPQGVGALIVDDAADAALPLVEAGHQERGRRPGTENTLGIIGFGAAAAAVDLAGWAAITARGEALERGLLAIEDVRIHGADRRRIGGTINAGFAGARGESIVIALDLAGIAASTGAACTSGSLEPSPVLLALGLAPERALEAVRFSLGHGTTDADIVAVLDVLPAIVKRARQHA